MQHVDIFNFAQYLRMRLVHRLALYYAGEVLYDVYLHKFLIYGTIQMNEHNAAGSIIWMCQGGHQTILTDNTLQN